MKEIRVNGLRARATLFGVTAIICIGIAVAPVSGAFSAGLAARTHGLSMWSIEDRGIKSTSASTGASAFKTAGSALVPGSVPSSASTVLGSVLRRFSPLYMGGGQRFTLAEATTIAKEFSVIAAHSGVLTPYLSAMKAANPSLKIVGYMNGAFDQSSGGTGYPLAWYAHDLKGNRIKSVMFGNWLMTPAPSWSSNVASKCTALIVKSKYDGCFLDTLGLGPLLPGYVTGLPVDPATKKVYMAATWIAGQSSTVAAVQKANPTAFVIANGLANGSKYFAPGGSTQPLLATSHVAMSEIFLRVSRNPVSSYPSLTNWKQDVDMLVNAEAHGWGVMTTTKLWCTATAAQQVAWHKFTLASFLLGAGGRSAFSFSTVKTATGLLATTPWDSLAIGTPTGAYTLSGGAYQRAFTHGLSVVNPGTASVTIKFSKPYLSLSGSIVTSETLAPHSGDVLIG